ncbi:MAG: 3-oxoacyl-[acyl-carrier-protein] synthase 2 [Candidatus Tectimicrobiota bacterium]|nr:MAG: 3-oxoacyl-[acyl-carrier-protein] synthase 2 [Candidatus Tectomicrobia bacterium]
MERRRVVITGLGAIAPNGIGKDAFWEALVAGRSGIDRITRFDASRYPCQIAGEVRDFRPTDYLEPREAKRLPRVAQFAIAAAKMAMADAGLEVTPDNRKEIGVCFGTSLGKAETFEADHLAFLDKGIRVLNPLTLVEIPSHGVTSHVAVALGVEGVCGTVATGCTNGLDVVQWGYTQIQLQRARAILVGCAEAVLTPFTFGVVCASRVLSTRNDDPQGASRPFEKYRDGMVLSEAAGTLLLEDYEQARARGAPMYAEILGGASGRDGNDLIHCDLSGAGMAHVMAEALHHAAVSRADIDYINAHGNSLPNYDLAETNAIKTVFGSLAYNIPISSIKSMIGQPFSAAGCLQAIASCLTLKHSIIPPTINYETPDPLCDLDYVPNRARRARVRTLLVHVHGIGGMDSALVLAKVKP